MRLLWRALLVVSGVLAPALSSAQGPPRGGGRPFGERGGRGGRPPIFEVTAPKVADLDPVAKLIRERAKLELSADQTRRLDSVATDLAREVAPFLARIDSITPLPRPGGEDRAPPRGIGALIDALAQVELRYQAGLQSALIVLGAGREEKALKLVSKEVDKMAGYTRGPAGFGGPTGPPR